MPFVSSAVRFLGSGVVHRSARERFDDALIVGGKDYPATHTQPRITTATDTNAAANFTGHVRAPMDADRSS